MATPITNIEIDGSSALVQGTLTVASGGTVTVASGGTLSSAAGSTVNLSAGTVTLPTIAWSGVSKSGSSLADLATKSASSLDSGTLAAARMAVMVGDSGAGGAQGAVPAPGAGDAAAGKYLDADGTWTVPTGVDNFLGLTDTPGSFAGAGGYVVKVNSGATALEFVAGGAGVTNFTDLGDVPATYSGSGSKLVAVNSGATGLEFVTASSAGTKTYEVWRATEGQPPASNYATLDSRNSIAVLDFDDSTDEATVFVGIMPEAASLGSGVTVIVKWMATSATSGNVVWACQIERCNTDLDSDSFDTAATATGAANGTSGIPTSTSIAQTNIDSVAEGELFRLKIYRDADNASDTMTGDAELIAVELRSAA